MLGLTAEQFLANWEGSGLADNQALAQAWSNFQHSGGRLQAEQLAEWLVVMGALTAWQAERLLDGQTDFLIGNYRLLDKLGAGGMGEVYRAEHTVMKREVAIKVLSHTRLENPTALARFRREVKAAAKLDHPNIVTAHDAGQFDDTHFLVMEYVRGEDFSNYAKRVGRVPSALACECIRQSALGLEHAHEQGLIHRDIKPANLLITWPEDQPLPIIKILDLGLARYTRDAVDDQLVEVANHVAAGKIQQVPEGHSVDSITVEGHIVGTPDYLSPEQIRGRDVDHRSDIFALGCTLFKLLTGQLPFAGNNLIEKLQSKILPSSPPAMSLGLLLPEAPTGLQEVVAKMLALDPAERYQTAAEVGQAIAPYSLIANQRPANQPKKTVMAQAISASSSGILPVVAQVAHDDASIVVPVEEQRYNDTQTGKSDHTPPEVVYQQETQSSSGASLFGGQPAKEEEPSFIAQLRQVSWSDRVMNYIIVFAAAAFLTILAGILATMSDPADSAAAVPKPVADWPAETDGLLFAWEASSELQPVRTAGRREHWRVDSRQLTPEGDAVFDRFGKMVFPNSGKILAPKEVNPRIYRACRRSNELTLEVVFTAANKTADGPARIVSFSSDSNSRNFTLGQEADRLLLRLRTTENGRNGNHEEPNLGPITPKRRQHVVITYRPGEIKCFFNGEAQYETAELAGDFSTWEPQHLLFGNELTGGRDWQGSIERVAIYSRCLSEEEIRGQYQSASQRRERTAFRVTWPRN